MHYSLKEMCSFLGLKYNRHNGARTREYILKYCTNVEYHTDRDEDGLLIRYFTINGDKINFTPPERGRKKGNGNE